MTIADMYSLTPHNIDAYSLIELGIHAALGEVSIVSTVVMNDLNHLLHGVALF